MISSRKHVRKNLLLTCLLPFTSTQASFWLSLYVNFFCLPSSRHCTFVMESVLCLSGSKNSYTNTYKDLCPISLIPFPAKLLETILVNFLKPVFLSNYDDHQYGFRPSSSTACALIALDEHITLYLDDKNTCGALVISYDYSKALIPCESTSSFTDLWNAIFPRPSFDGLPAICLTENNMC